MSGIDLLRLTIAMAEVLHAHRDELEAACGYRLDDYTVLQAGVLEMESGSGRTLLRLDTTRDNRTHLWEN